VSDPLNRKEFNTMYTRFGPAVRARCRSICGNYADADEALQETFVRAWRARDKFDGAKPLNWLQVIARNTSLELLRKRKPWTNEPWQWLNRPDPTTLDPQAKLDAERLVAQFSAEDAAMLRLRYAENWRIREIAEHFGSSERSVRRQLERIETRARALLRVPEMS